MPGIPLGFGCCFKAPGIAVRRQAGGTVVLHPGAFRHLGSAARLNADRRAIDPAIAMKIPSRHARPALMMVCAIPLASFVLADDRRPPAGLTDPPAANYPDPFLPPASPVFEPDQQKLDHALLALLNPTARLPGQTVADYKLEMQRLDQIIFEPDANDGTAYGPVNSDLLRVMVRFDELPPLATPGSIAGGHFFSWTENEEWNVLFGWLEENRIMTVAAIPEVTAVVPVEPPQHRTAGGEGDLVINGPTARTAYSADGGVPPPGQNIKVGIISNGVTNLTTAQTSGDLPGTVNLTALGAGSGDEGTAMLEIVHEIAPGADLYFAPSGADMNAHLTAATVLAQAGCQIIADDVGWYQEPFFEAGFLGPAMANLMAVHPQLMFFSAAGNDGETHQQRTYIDVAPPSGLHDYLLWVYMPRNSSVDIYLQWNEPQNSIPAGNYRILAIDNADGVTKFWSTHSPGPNRTLHFSNNTGADTNFQIEIQAVNDIGALLEIFMEPKNGANHYITNTSPVDAIFGHPGNPQVRAVTAVDYTTPSIIEFFASQGPWTQLGGGSIGPKPDFTAPDGVSFSGAGGNHIPSYIPATPPPYYFFGTSAATPHVAGLAALVWSAEPNQQRMMIDNALAQGATDLGVPGMDNVFGNGLVDAVQSLIFLKGPSPPTTVTATDGTVGDRVNITWNAGVGADAYHVYANTTSDPGGALLISLPPVTTTAYADYEQPLGFAIRDQTMYYWIESYNNRFMRTGEWSALETGYLQPTNLPPSLTVPTGTFNAATRVPIAFGGIGVTDPDAGGLPVLVSLGSGSGTLTVNTGVSGGVTPGQVANNGSGNVNLTAPMSTINTTLADSAAVLYQSMPGISGTQTIYCAANDLGNTGWGGPLTDNQSFDITVHATRFAAWQHEEFPDDISDPSKEATIWGRNANPDNDPHSNAWEFFMNTDPNATTPAGQTNTMLQSGNFHILTRIGAGINPLSWTLESSSTLLSGSWGPAGESSTYGPHPDAPADAVLWDLSVPYAPPAKFFRIRFDTDFVEP